MTLSTSPNTESRVAASTETSKNASPAAELTASVFMGGKPVLKNWKVYGDVPQDPAQESDAQETDVARDELVTSPDAIEPDVAEEKIAPRQYSDHVIRAARPATPVWLQVGQAVAVFLTMAWLTYAGIYIFALPNLVKTVTSSPLALGGILASVLAPVAMLWLCIATWQRRSDAHIYAEALREELRGLFYPSADQHNLIGEDIRGLMKQATEMSATSRGAIKAIQRARTGLRAEIRDFAGVSQKAEFHIDRLAESLSKRAEELLSLTEVIEAQTENISTKAQHGITAWENVSAEISELGDEIHQIFTTNTQKLIETSETAAKTRGDMDEQIDRLEDVAQSLADGADRLQTSLTGAEQISQSIATVMDTVAGNLDQVEETADMFLTRTNDIDEALTARAESLKSVVGELLSSTEGVQEAGDLAVHKMGEAVSLAVSGADTLVNAVRRSKDMMDKTVTEASAEIAKTSQMADEKLAALMEEARANRDRLTELMAEIAEKQALLAQSTEAIDTRREQIMATAELAVAGLQAAADHMVTRTDEPLGRLQTSIDTLTTQADTLDEKLSVRVVVLSQETGKLKTVADDVSALLQARSDDLSAALETASSVSERLSDEIETQRTSLSGFVADMEQKTRMVSGLLADQTQDLETSILVAQEKMSSFGAAFFDKGDSLVEKVKSVSEHIARYEDRLSVTLVSVDEKTASMADRVQGQMDRMEKLSDVLIPEAERMLDQADEIHSKFDDLKQACETTVDTAVRQIEDLGQRMESRVESLGRETFETARALDVVSDKFVDTLTDMKEVAADAQGRISAVQAGLQDRVDDLRLVSDQVQIKVDALQENLGGYAQDLNDVLQCALSDLDLATERFGQTADSLDKRAETVTAKVVDATRLYTEEGHRMSLLGEQAAHKSVRIVAVIQQESDKLLQTTKSSLLELQKSGDSLSVRTKEIEDYMRTSIQHVKTYGDALRQQTGALASQSMDVVDQISSAVTTLSIRANDIKQIGMTLVDDVESAWRRLDSGTGVLELSAKTAIETVDDVVTDFSRQGEEIGKTVTTLVGRMKDVKEIQSRSERDAFFNAAKFVIESLYSLAVDVSRHLEGDLDTRVLRAYQKGDVAAYVRHLLDICPKMPVEKSQRKFIEDSEFRTYVLRFVRQYEEVLDQAHANDYADLLGTVFATSDIGKLYRILCDVAGRSPRD